MWLIPNSSPNPGPGVTPVSSSHLSRSPPGRATQFRRPHSKAKTGCVVCKIRRIKCDETRPHCRKCTSTGRECDGYVAEKSKGESDRLLQSKQKNRGLRIISYIPSENLRGITRPNPPLHSLQSRKLSHIAGHFEPYFWDHILLQFSHTYPAVQYALVALNSIYQGSHRDIRSPTKTPAVPNYDRHALQQYNEALRHLIKYLSSTQRNERATLLSCLVFVWIDLLQNNLESAFRHLDSGLKILRGMSKSLPSATTKGKLASHDTEDVDGSLSRLFIRLSSQAALHGACSRLPEVATIPNDAIEVAAPTPRSFSDVFESRSWLDREINFVMCYIRRLRDKDHYASVGALAIQHFRKSHLERIRHWYLVTMAMAAKIPTPWATFQNLAIGYLQLYYTMLLILLRTLLSGSEMHFDEYTSEFERMIKLAECIIAKPNIDQDSEFSFDVAIIPPLFFLVLKCRVVRLRRQGVTLLRRAPEREGVWRREGVIKACEWKIKIEEQGRGQLAETDMLPEFARIYREHIPESDWGTLSTNTRPRMYFCRGDAGVVEHVPLPDNFEDVYDMGNML